MIKPKWILTGGLIFGVLSLIVFSVIAVIAKETKLIYKSIFLGDLLAFVSFLLGLLFTNWGIKKSDKKFLISLYGGTLIRLSLLVVLVILVLIFLEINEISFIFSNLFFYFFYVIVEITYLNHRER